MPRIPLSPQALAAAMNAELSRRGVPAFVRVAQVVRADGGAAWNVALERSPVPLHRDGTAERFAEALFAWEDAVDAVAAWAAERFDVVWEAAPARGAVFVPSPVHAGPPPHRPAPVPAQKTTGGDH